MNRALLGHTWRANRWRLLIISIGLFLWGAVLPVVYDSFGSLMRDVFENGSIPPQFAQFGGGDIFSLSGAVAIGFVHPIAVGLNLVFALGFAANAIAGERQHGTLEVLLARPLSRRGLYLTLAAAAAVFVAVTLAALTLGSLAGATLTGRTAELGVANLPILWLNGTMLFWAFASIALLASALSDRLTPAIGISLAVVLVSYFLEVIGSLWPDAAFLQPYSLFHYVDAKADLAGLPQTGDFLVLGAVIAVAVGAALVIFPRRDLAAPA
jgi:ABC-2 type transport system permease protein